MGWGTECSLLGGGVSGGSFLLRVVVAGVAGAGLGGAVVGAKWELARWAA